MITALYIALAIVTVLLLLCFAFLMLLWDFCNELLHTISQLLSDNK